MSVKKKALCAIVSDTGIVESQERTTSTTSPLPSPPAATATPTLIALLASHDMAVELGMVPWLAIGQEVAYRSAGHCPERPEFVVQVCAVAAAVAPASSGVQVLQWH